MEVIRAKRTSNLQTSVGFNVGECEFNGLVHGEAHGLGLQALHVQLWNQRSVDRRVREFECEGVCVSMMFGQATPCSNTLLVDPEHGCSKQMSDRESTNSKLHQRHLDESNRSQNPRQSSQDNGFRGSATKQIAQTILNEREEADFATRECPITLNHSQQQNSRHVQTRSRL